MEGMESVTRIEYLQRTRGPLDSLHGHSELDTTDMGQKGW